MFGDLPRACHCRRKKLTNVVKSAPAAVLREHVRWLPKVDLPAVPGSAHRVLTNMNGVWMWEGKPIHPAEQER